MNKWRIWLKKRGVFAEIRSGMGEGWAVTELVRYKCIDNRDSATGHCPALSPLISMEVL
jgi:hypothetical protein